eukprot:Protomagalhaensia_wolfi_Nauph_80__1198@NODE_1707_length_1387_cov_133_480712_g55_i1_p2_GENE_NODE_1707_length_1387_cov_133_480712_g55_i1NODE_1707_length_1387_cov_133_480712_g55_i1_p2_ORF_typecomplete_len166_score42_95Nup54/PF13874_6/0_17Nup54/PF13874_6/11DUF4479/PF14794_6/9_3DUF4479/PF14794_6/13Ntox1/PF15500_6/9_3e02Ntox1/PF15500_6/0_053HisKA_2/PF07568_12/0_18HAUSaugmin3/PF14932_6/0_16APC_N_CC/PF16689_5/2_3APC_N_CC/PF16689_5/8_4e03APC_N_CC/PF16689_5/41MPM1/PF17234_2/1_8DUF16/PF01519_16/76DUF16/PF0
MVRHCLVNGKYVPKDLETREKLSEEQVKKLRDVLHTEETHLRKALEKTKSDLTGTEAAKLVERQHLVFADSSDSEEEEDDSRSDAGLKDDQEEERLKVIGVSDIKKSVRLDQSHVANLNQEIKAAYKEGLKKVESLKAVHEKLEKLERLAAKPAAKPLPYYKRKQ